ncbi:MAG: hypothetical protein AAGL24_06160 [Pseudomonadota bacterium]
MIAALSSILDCVFLRWQPGFGDPTVVAWVAVAAYAAAVVLAGAVVHKSGGLAATRHSRETRFWLIVLLVVAALFVNKQADLQSLARAVGRCVAIEGGWYDQRQPVRLAIFAMLTMLAVGLALCIATLLRGIATRHWMAAFGLFLLGVFSLVRMIGLTHLDLLVGLNLLALRGFFLVEIAGALFVVFGALQVLGRIRTLARLSR